MWWVHARLAVLFVFFFIGIFQIDPWFIVPTLATVVVSIWLGYDKNDNW